MENPNAWEERIDAQGAKQFYLRDRNLTICDIGPNLDWFSLDRYTVPNGATFGAHEWAYQIFRRTLLKKAFEQAKKVGGTIQGPHCEIPDIVMQLYFHFPIPSVPLSGFDYLPKRTVINSTRSNDLLLKVLNAGFKSDLTLGKDAPAPFGLEGSTTHYSEILIDLAASDQFLLEDFKFWLSETRANQKAQSGKPMIRTPTVSKFQQWHNNRVLPYADLLLWQEWTGNKITSGDMINRLMPEFEFQSQTHPLRETKADYSKVIAEENIRKLLYEAGRPVGKIASIDPTVENLASQLLRSLSENEE